MTIIEGWDYLEVNRHVWPLRKRNEPFGAERCLRCGISYAGAGPVISVCPVISSGPVVIPDSGAEDEKNLILQEIHRRLKIIEEVGSNIGEPLKKLMDAIICNKHRG